MVSALHLRVTILDGTRISERKNRTFVILSVDVTIGSFLIYSAYIRPSFLMIYVIIADWVRKSLVHSLAKETTFMRAMICGAHRSRALAWLVGD